MRTDFEHWLSKKLDFIGMLIFLNEKKENNETFKFKFFDQDSDFYYDLVIISNIENFVIKIKLDEDSIINKIHIIKNVKFEG
jgi:hypothetical protein